MFARNLIRLVLLGGLLASGLQADAPSAPQQTAPASEKASEDSLGRSTPLGTVLGFIKAENRGDDDQATNYLDTKKRGEAARELARQLQVILDRQTSIDLAKLSRRPEGSRANAQNPDRDLVAVADTSSGRLEIWVDRVQRGDNPPIWLFSQETLQHVPKAYEEMESVSEIEHHLPGWLKTTFLTLPLWQLFIAVFSIPLILVLGTLTVRLLKPFLTFFVRRIAGSTEVDPAQGFVGPLRLLLFGALFVINANYSNTLLGRNFWHALGNVLIVFGLTWLLLRIVSLANYVALARLKRVRSSDKIALAGLLGRLAQIGVVIIGALVVLHLAGVNLTAALTGLGIGGLAVAFAAQKTLENLFGGIMIISDQPVRIGDLCRIDGVTGVVVDIGLRSTRIRTSERTIMTIPNGRLATLNVENLTFRDKFWFHPIIALRHDTTVDQIRTVLREIRAMLDKHDNVEPGTEWVRFVNMGEASQDVEIVAYVFAANLREFLGVQEDLLLRILDIVESAGAAFALPTQVTHLIDGSDVTTRKPPESRSAIGKR